MAESFPKREPSYLYLLAVAAPVLTSLMTMPVLTRLLDSATVGKVTLILLLAQLLSILLVLGLPGPLTRAYFTEKRDRVEALCRRLSRGLSVAALAISGAQLGSLILGNDVNIGVAAVSFACSWAALTMRQVESRALGRARLFTMQAVVASSLPQLTAVLPLFFWASTAGYIGGLQIGVVVASILNVVFGERPKSKTEMRLLLDSLRVGLPTLPHGAGLFLFAAVIRFDASIVMGLEATAQLQVAALMGQAPLTILGALNNSWNVGLYRRKESEWPVFLSQSLQWILVLSLLLIALVGGFASVVVGFLAGPLLDHDLIALSSLVMSLSAVPLCFYLANVHVLVGLGKTGALAWATPVALGLGLCIGHFMGTAYGLWGLAVTMPSAYCFLALFTSIVRRRLVAFGLLKLRNSSLYFGGAAALLLVHLVSSFLSVAVSALALLPVPWVYRRFEHAITGPGGESERSAGVSEP